MSDDKSPVQELKERLNAMPIGYPGMTAPQSTADGYNNIRRIALSLVDYLETLERRVSVLEQGVINRRLNDLDDQSHE